ncbi:hypothetical protein D3C87_1909990 [compost metagenome]
MYCPWLEPVGKDLFVKRIYRNEDAIEALEADLIDFSRLVESYLEILRTPKKMSGADKVAAASRPAADTSTSTAAAEATPAPQPALFADPAPLARAGNAVIDNPF